MGWKIKTPKVFKQAVKTATNVAKNFTPTGVAAGLVTKTGLIKENPFDSVSKSLQEGDILKTGTNLIKNLTPTGQLAGALQATGITDKNLIDQAAGLLSGKKGGGGGGGGGEPGAPGAEDIGSISKRYEQALEQQRLKNLDVGGQLTESLRKQAMGEAPSLAEAQLKSAQTRNLAQTLAAAQGAGASPLSTRQMLQMRGQQGRELAETGTQMAMQERQAAQQALGGQLASQAGISRADIETGFGIAKTPAQMAQEREMQQAKFQAEKDLAKRQQQSGILGGLLSSGASLGAAALMSDERQKEAPDEDDEKKPFKGDKKKKAFYDTISGLSAPKDIGEGIANAGKVAASILSMKEKSAPPKAFVAKQPAKGVSFISPDILSDERQKEFPDAGKEATEMMDKLKPSKFKYKNPELPGAAEGTRYGVMAQDLEKSSLGKTLVKNTPNGKMIDTAQGFGAVLAAQAELNRRLKKIEKKGK